MPSDAFDRAPMDQEQAAQHEPGQLTRQTEGLDEGVTSSIAGPDWDPDLVREADESMGGATLDGEVEAGPEDRSERG